MAASFQIIDNPQPGAHTTHHGCKWRLLYLAVADVQRRQIWGVGGSYNMSNMGSDDGRWMFIYFTHMQQSGLLQFVRERP